MRYLALLATCFSGFLFVVAEGGMLAYLISLRESIQESSLSGLATVIIVFCTGYIFLLIAKHTLEQKEINRSAKAGIKSFIKNIDQGSITPGSMSQIFISSISAGLPSDLNKAAGARLLMIGSASALLAYGVFLLFIEPIVFAVSSTIIFLVVTVKLRLSVALVHLSNKRILSIVIIYRQIKEHYDNHCSDYFTGQYGDAALNIMVTDRELAKKQFQSRLSMIGGRLVDFGLCVYLVLQVIGVDSIVYFLLVNITRDIFLRSSFAYIDSYLDSVLSGRIVNKVANIMPSPRFSESTKKEATYATG